MEIRARLPDGDSIYPTARCEGDVPAIPGELSIQIEHAGNEEELGIASDLYSPDVLVAHLAAEHQPGAFKGDTGNSELRVPQYRGRTGATWDESADTSRLPRSNPAKLPKRRFGPMYEWRTVQRSGLHYAG
jgi:hypothetical protein